jgi:hypothetical protein
VGFTIEPPRYSPEYEEYVRFKDLLPCVCRVDRIPRFKKRDNVPLVLQRWLDEHPEINSSDFGYTEPNIQSHYMGLCKYGNPHPKVDSKCWEFSKECVHREFWPKMCGSRITDVETVISQIDKQTSNGTFLKKLFDSKGKFFAHPLSREYLQEYWDLLLHSDKMIHCFREMSDKYEVRPTEKLNLNKIRVFTADETASIVANNRFSLDMNNRFYQAHTRFSSVVGRSKFYGGFQIFYEMLRRFGFFASTDVSGWDTVQWFLLQVEQMLFRWDCFHPDEQTEENWIRFTNYFLSTIMSFLRAIDGNVYFKQYGVCSGFGNTLIDNTINLFRVWTYVFAKCYFDANKDDQFFIDSLMAIIQTSPIDSLQRTRCMQQLEEFQKTSLSYDYMVSVCSFLLTGDDNTHSVDSSIIHWFNCETVCAAFATLGITMNYEHKFYKTIEEVSFLSQNWVKISGISIYLPSPETSKILGSLIHGSKSGDPRWNLMRAFALRIECWANLEARKLLDDFIVFVLRQYQLSLVGSVAVPGKEGLELTMSQVMSCRLTETQMAKLYTGQEGADCDLTSVLKLVTLVTDLSFSFYGS